MADPTLIAKAAEIAVEAGGALEKEAHGFLKTILKPPAQALGGLLADQISAFRHGNLIKIVVRAKRKLEEAGVSPKEAPLKIIHPLLEAASLEDEPDLQEMWVCLLAGAASDGTLFRSAFTDILRQLSSAEARFLKRLTEWLESEIARYEADPYKQGEFPSSRIGGFEKLSSMFLEANEIHGEDADSGEARQFAAIAFDNLCRLGIMTGPTLGRSTYAMTNFGLHFLSRLQDGKKVETAQKNS